MLSEDSNSHLKRVYHFRLQLKGRPGRAELLDASHSHMGPRSQRQHLSLMCWVTVGMLLLYLRLEGGPQRARDWPSPGHATLRGESPLMRKHLLITS